MGTVTVHVRSVQEARFSVSVIARITVNTSVSSERVHGAVVKLMGKMNIEPITVTLDIKMSDALRKLASDNFDINDPIEFIELLKTAVETNQLPTGELIKLRAAVWQWNTEIEQELEERSAPSDETLGDDDITETDIIFP